MGSSVMMGIGEDTNRAVNIWWMAMEVDPTESQTSSQQMLCLLEQTLSLFHYPIICMVT